MSVNVGTLTADLILGTGGFTKPLTQAENDLAKFTAFSEKHGLQFQNQVAGMSGGVRQLGGASQQASSQVGLLGGTLRSIGSVSSAAFGGLVGGIAALKVDDLIKGATDAAKRFLDLSGHIVDVSDKLGVSTDAVQKWKFAAEQTGSSLQSMTGAATKLFLAITDPSKDALDAFKDLGLSVESLKAMKPEDAFNAVADAVVKIPDPIKQIEVGASLMGKGFADNLPAMKQGLKVLGDEAERAGLIMSERTVKAGDKLGDAWDKLVSVGSNLLSAVFSPILPLLASLMEILTPLITLFGDLVTLALKPLQLVLGLVSDALSTVIGWFTDLSEPIGVASEAVGDLWAWFHDKFGPIIDPIISLLKGLISVVKDVGAIVGTIFGGIVTAAGNLFSGVTGWLGEKFLSIFRGIKSGVETIVGVFNGVTSAVLTSAKSLYEGVKTWMGDKLQSVWDGVKNATGAVTGFFSDMYHKVVGGSYVPDMVIEIGEWMGPRLDEAMVQPARVATDMVTGSFTTMSRDVLGALSDVISAAGSGWHGLGQYLIGETQNFITAIMDIALPGLSQVASALMGVFGGQFDATEANNVRDHFVSQFGGQAGIARLIQQYNNDSRLMSAFSAFNTAGSPAAVSAALHQVSARLQELGWRGPGGGGTTNTNVYVQATTPRETGQAVVEALRQSGALRTQMDDALYGA